MLTAPPPPSKKAICPQCTMGRLVKKCLNPFNFKEQWMECDRKDAAERPCDYREDVHGKALQNTGALPETQPTGRPSDHDHDGKKLDKGKAPERHPANIARPGTWGLEPEAGPARAAEMAIDLTEDGQFTPERSLSPVPVAPTVSNAVAADSIDSAPGLWKDTKSRFVETAADILSSQTVVDLVSDMSSQVSDMAGRGGGSPKQVEVLAKPRNQASGKQQDAYQDEFDSSDDEELARLTDYIYTSARKPSPQVGVKPESPSSPIAKIERDD
ncbi:hypothetical protein NEUTE2DRAFT_77256 [Neurospora tetrasperma FGSC 2509]|nr:hypothetical protein NEUTE2DRAFT_77256 [Neurospora tetrasperma FGSC 2509]